MPGRKEGYTLDLDGTGLLHEDGRQEGVRVDHTRVGPKPCLQPLLAVFARDEDLRADVAAAGTLASG